MKRIVSRTAAYGFLAASLMLGSAMNVRAASVREVLPSAGIDLSLTQGVSLAKIKDQNSLSNAAKNQKSLKELKAEFAQNNSKLNHVALTASSMVKDSVPTPVEEVSASVLPSAGIDTLLKENRKSAADKDNGKEEFSVVNILAAAGAGAIDANVLPAAEEMISSNDSVKKKEPEETDKADKADTDAFTENENDLLEDDEMYVFVEPITKPIETTQTPAEVLAMQAANMTEEEKSFTELVIAQVDHYVNVRSLPSEEGEILGKLYDKSVGTFIEEENGWYKISSGNVTGYVKGEFCVTGRDAVDLAKQVGTRIATVTTTGLRVRESADIGSGIIGMVPNGDELEVLAEEDGWVKVNIEEGDGWVSTEFVTLRTDFVKAESKAEEAARLKKEEEARRKALEAANKAAGKKKKKNDSNNYNSASSYIEAGGGSATGNAVAQYALRFVGNPYVYGGSSLTNGTDCSGFVMSVYNNFGVSLPHSSSRDRSVGSTVGSLAEAQPGDILCYSGHVALYIGGGQIVHASTSRTGIIVSNATYRNILSIRRIF